MVRAESLDLDALRLVFEERKVTKVKLGGFDVDGVLRGKYVSLEKFFSAAQSGLGFADVPAEDDVAEAEPALRRAEELLERDVLAAQHAVHVEPAELHLRDLALLEHEAERVQIEGLGTYHGYLTCKSRQRRSHISRRWALSIRTGPTSGRHRTPHEASAHRTSGLDGPGGHGAIRGLPCLVHALARAARGGAHRPPLRGPAPVARAVPRRRHVGFPAERHRARAVDGRGRLLPARRGAIAPGARGLLRTPAPRPRAGRPRGTKPPRPGGGHVGGAPHRGGPPRLALLGDPGHLRRSPAARGPCPGAPAGRDMARGERLLADSGLRRSREHPLCPVPPRVRRDPLASPERGTARSAGRAGPGRGRRGPGVDRGDSPWGALARQLADALRRREPVTTLWRVAS